MEEDLVAQVNGNVTVRPFSLVVEEEDVPTLHILWLNLPAHVDQRVGRAAGRWS